MWLLLKEAFFGFTDGASRNRMMYCCLNIDCAKNRLNRLVISVSFLQLTKILIGNRFKCMLIDP